jgi:alcohol dehydrogenase class IV
MESATIGGIAISNTRTGNIHEAAGALLEKTTLNHPQTLFVFFRKAIEQYESEIFEFESNLINSFRINAEWSDLKRIDDVIGWWEAIFEKFSIKDKIAKTLINEVNDVDSIGQYIYNRIASDLVWKNKESPVVLNDKNIKVFINESLSQYGLHQTQ